MPDFLPYEEQLLWEKWKQSRHPDVANALMTRYMPLVTFHLRRIGSALPKTVNRDELKSFGMTGLYDALLKFEPSRDLKFDTYASFRVRGAILDGLRKADWLPRSTREKVKKIEAATARLEQMHLRAVTAEEVANELNMTAEEVSDATAEQFFSHMLSVDEAASNAPSAEYEVRDERIKTPEEAMIRQEQVKELTAQISKLTEKEQLVIDLFYKEELTLTEIGEILNLSTSRISQIHSKALFKLKQFFAKTTR